MPLLIIDRHAVKNSSTPYNVCVFTHSSLIMSQLTAVLILLYEWQRFRMKLDCVLLSPLLCHKSFLKCAISSYLYTLIICVKSSYLNHLHNWLAASLWPIQFAFSLWLQCYQLSIYQCTNMHAWKHKYHFLFSPCTLLLLMTEMCCLPVGHGPWNPQPRISPFPQSRILL